MLNRGLECTVPTIELARKQDLPDVTCMEDSDIATISYDGVPGEIQLDDVRLSFLSSNKVRIVIERISTRSNCILKNVACTEFKYKTLHESYP